MSAEAMELAVVNAQNAVQIFTGGGLTAILDGIEAKVRAISLDGSTAAGRDEIRSTAYKVARTKTALDAEAKKLTEGWRASTAQVNAERKRAQERLDALADEVRAPLTAFENKEKARIAGHEAALADFGRFLNLRATKIASGTLAAILAESSALHADRQWEESVYRAEVERKKVTAYLTERLESQRKYEADQEELARLRREAEERAQAEREAKLKAEAAETARLEAERKAKAAADAEARRVIEASNREAERVRAEAAKVQAEHDRVQKEADDARHELEGK